MERRKFLIGVGSAAAGGSALVGSGAFSSATINNRQVTANITADDNSIVSLVPGDDNDITLNSSELRLDLSGKDGEGINVRSLYTWGDHDNPSEDYAFKIQNQDEQSYNNLTFEYEIANDDWLTEDTTTWNDPSHFRFTVYGFGPYSGSMRAPNVADGQENNPASRELTPSGFSFDSGQEYYVVVDVDTRGLNRQTGERHDDISPDQDLSGTLTIGVDDRV